MKDVYPSIDCHHPGRKCKILIVCDDIIADMLIHKKIEQIVIELFICFRKLNNSIVFITQTHLAVSKNVGINFKYYLIVNIPNKGEIYHIAFNHSSDIQYDEFMKIYENVLMNHFLV